MNEAKRRKIVEWASENRPIWRGKPATIAGWKNPYSASVTSARPGFWAISWEGAERVMNGGSLDNEIIWKTGGGWLGCEVV